MKKQVCLNETLIGIRDEGDRDRMMVKELKKAQSHERRKQRSREYYHKNKYTLCYNKLNRDCFKHMHKIRLVCSERVNQYMSRYPFEEYAERQIRKELYGKGIYRSNEKYADCYDAGMLAYLYSIHRCAMMECEHVVPYIIKMIRVYVICALVIYYETQNLCRTNGLREIRIDADVNGWKY